MFIETKEGQTHATCEEQLKKYGGKAKCCLCNKHDGCDLADSHGMFSKKEMTKAIKHTGKYMKKEQDKVLKEFTKEQKLINYVARKIEKGLSFTNGWHIDDNHYREVCIKLATKIVNKLKK